MRLAFNLSDTRYEHGTVAASIRQFAVNSSAGGEDPPDDDPEGLLIHTERQWLRQQALCFVLDRLSEHRLGPAFLEHLLCGQSWQELQAVHGIKANTLSRSFWRSLAPLLDECRERIARGEGGHG